MPAPAPGTSAPSRLLVYDGDCSLCTASVDLLDRMGLVGEDETAPVGDLSGDLLETVRDAGIHEQVVLVEEGSRTRVGVAALLALLGPTRIGKLVRPFSRGPLRGLAEAAYGLVSHNRRILAPPAPRPSPCDCDPPDVPAFRVALGLLALLPAAGAGLLLGRSAPAGVPVTAPLVALAAALCVPGLPALFLPAPVRGRLLTSLAWCSGVASFVVLPGALVAPALRPEEARFGLAVLGAAALGVGLRLLRRRVAHFGLPVGWLVLAAAGGVAGGGWLAAAFLGYL